ncbi:MAG: GMC family oxidoreductase N-terminal domain-containing protein [Orrella sp.]
MFDYVIVGGGTAACVLANRLSADGLTRVLMLEAGGEPRSPWIRMPAGFSKLLVNATYNWRFETKPEDNVLGRTIAIPRGRGLGGSSLINGMIYVRGQPSDYDQWAAMGATDWSAQTVMPYFQKLENYAFAMGDRGRDGPMHVDQVRERFSMASAMIDAASQAGYAHNPDYNGQEQDGFGYYQVSQQKGRRWSAYDGYLKPALSRANLQVTTNAFVEKLLFEDKRCIGVAYRQDGVLTTVKASRSVILAAGAVQSPQLLEVSGIGDPVRLQRLGIKVVHANAQVGENYIDHYATRMNWRVKGARTLNESTRGWRLIRSVMQYALTRRGFLTLGTGLVHGFVRSQPEVPTPDVQYFFMHASYADAAVRALDTKPGMTMGVTGLRPTSRGSIHIESANAKQAPAIRPNFLDTPEDQRCLINGMKIVRQIVSQPAIAQYVDHEMNPGLSVQTDDDWLQFARQNGQTIYHPIGTCRMGSDAHAVVDSRLRVNGVQGLRVVDASVFPAMVSGNTQAAVMAVAERASDLILEDALANGS